MQLIQFLRVCLFVRFLPLYASYIYNFKFLMTFCPYSLQAQVQLSVRKMFCNAGSQSLYVNKVQEWAHVS